MSISLEAIRLIIRNRVYIPFVAKKNGRKLKVRDFSIISNNCWGGTVYESYGMQKLSPTVGMFIMPADYIHFCENIKEYLNKPLEFISPNESKWVKELSEKSNWGKYLIGKIGDVELHMLHYHNEEEAKRKWESRIKRINYERLIFKFNDQNGCKADDIRAFLQLPCQKKLCFVASTEMRVSDEVVLIKQPKKFKNGIMASREPFGKTKYIDLTEYINKLDD